MTDIRRTFPCITALVLVLAACSGGGGTTTTVPPDGAATSGPSQATATEPPAATTDPGAGGGAATDVCALVTPDELAEIFGVPSVTTTVFRGPPDTCSVAGEDGTALAAWVLSRFQAGSVEQSVYTSMMGDPSAISVSGIGDRAAHVQSTGFLVLKGSTLVSIGLIAGVRDLSEEEQRQLAEQLGAKAAGRM